MQNNKLKSPQLVYLYCYNWGKTINHSRVQISVRIVSGEIFGTFLINLSMFLVSQMTQALETLFRFDMYEKACHKCKVKDNAPTGNRTRVARMGILHDTTTPPAPYHLHKDNFDLYFKELSIEKLRDILSYQLS